MGSLPLNRTMAWKHHFRSQLYSSYYSPIHTKTLYFWGTWGLKHYGTLIIKSVEHPGEKHEQVNLSHWEGQGLFWDVCLLLTAGTVNEAKRQWRGRKCLALNTRLVAESICLFGFSWICNVTFWSYFSYSAFSSFFSPSLTAFAVFIGVSL